MKKTLLVLSLIAFTLTGCDKKTSTPQPSEEENTDTTNYFNGQWKLTMYDSINIDTIGSVITSAAFIGTASSSTVGTGQFSITFNLGVPDTENFNYTLSGSKTRVVFTKTGGNSTRLSGGGTWTIDSMTANLIHMRSSTNRCVRMRR